MADLPATVLLLDVDGVVTPLAGCTAWGDDVPASRSRLRISVSPTMCAHLDEIGRRDDVRPYWLTSWEDDMRAQMDPFPGRHWPSLPTSVQGTAGVFRGWPVADVWWKWAVVAKYFQDDPISRVVWCDDRFDVPAAPERSSKTRRSLIESWLSERGIESLILASDPWIGLTPHDLKTIEDWLNGSRSA